MIIGSHRRTIVWMFAVLLALSSADRSWGQGGDVTGPRSADDAAAPVGKDDANLPPPVVDDGIRRWTTDWSFEDIDVANLLSRLASIGIQIPIIADGDVTVGFAVGVPIAHVNDGQVYRLRGRLSSRRLQLENLLLEDFSADIVYDNGVLRLDRIRGRWTDAASDEEPGRFSGNGSLAILPRGKAVVRIHADDLTIGPLYDLITAANREDAGVPVTGTVTGDIDWAAPIDSLVDIATWTATSNLRVRKLKSGESMPLSINTGDLTVRDGIVAVPQLRVTSDADASVGFDGAAQVELVGRRRFEFQVRGNDVPMQALSMMAAQAGMVSQQAVAGKLDLDLRGNGQWASKSWSVRGRVGTPRLEVFRQNVGLIEHELMFDQQRFSLDPIHTDTPNAKMLIRRIAADYSFTDQGIEVSKLSAEVFGGRASGNVAVPFGDEGDWNADLVWEGIQPKINLAALLPFGVPKTWTSASALTSGAIQWNVPAAAIMQPARHRGTAKLSAADIRLGSGSIGQVDLAIQAGDGTIRLNGDGKLFGGAFSVETKSDVDANDDWSSWLRKVPVGQISIRSAKVDQLIPVLRPDDPRRYRGTVSAVANIHPSALAFDAAQTVDAAAAAGRNDTDNNIGDNNIGDGDRANLTLQMSASDLAVDGRTVSRGGKAELQIVDGVLVIRRASAAYGGGRLIASGRWPLGQEAAKSGRRTLQFTFSGVDAQTGLMLVAPSIADRVGGAVSGSLTVAGDQDYRIRGSITVRESSLFTVSAGSVNAGVNGSLSSDFGRWNLRLRSISGNLAGGEIRGEADLSSSTALSGTFDLDSRWSVRRVDFGTLIATTGTTTSLAHGRITGAMSVAGRRIRSVSDLNGNFTASLAQTQASAVPGLLKANQFLGALSLTNTQFDTGTLKGTIGRGAVQVEEFSLRADRVRVFAQGRIGIADWRMDLDAVIATGLLDGDSAKIAALAAQLAVEAFIPVGLIVEINRMFSNRTLFLGVTGPASDPQVRLKPIETIRQAAVRFLVREAMVLVSAGTRIAN
ncbi:hypothetical protein K227x_24280 [Rubripirellula lacrimiformis]|uniref:Uncharacterized protein n=1 Tax=Rubripirellula lacrimiformis TaxID=1930273 RepID=A0A517NA85_9BACT|nr:AsmA-like C-terminal region-containing protein [Rubripirellula lacrimiformis]QDT04042.1 hypothetical protein K227x_24280 [Rubripirellula lacrimiformis]